MCRSLRSRCGQAKNCSRGGATAPFVAKLYTRLWRTSTVTVQRRIGHRSAEKPFRQKRRTSDERRSAYKWAATNPIFSKRKSNLVWARLAYRWAATTARRWGEREKGRCLRNADALYSFGERAGAWKKRRRRLEVPAVEAISGAISFKGGSRWRSRAPTQRRAKLCDLSHPFPTKR